jgi:tripartite-type tricarboxylate transporter receptor subunit TctC
MQRFDLGRKCVLIAGAAALLFAPHAAAAQNAGEQLRGKVVSLYIGGGVGGGVDALARSLIPYLTKHMPGNPAIIVKNQPGAGGMQAVENLYATAPKDGTAIGTTATGPIVEPVLGTTPVHYDLLKFHWIGSLANDQTSCFTWQTSTVKTIADAKTREVPLATTGARSNSTLIPLMLNAVLGTRFKMIPGYDGGTAMLAIERGEVDGRCTSIGSIHATNAAWITEKKITMLVQVGLAKDPEFPDVPLALDLAPNAQDRAAMEFFLIPSAIQDPFMLPPGVPESMVVAWRRGFDAAVADKAFLADVEKRHQDARPNNGEYVQKALEKMFSAPRPVIDRAIALTTPPKG